jgi:hypothetical protein
MSASSCSLDESDKLLLRWSEDAFSPSREELVQMLETRGSEAVISSSLSVLEKTEVFLIGKYSTESGVVRSCRPSGGKYIVTISIHSQKPNPPDIDPGLLALDSWMTEEQEKAILDQIEKEIGNQQFRSLATARACFNTTCCEGTAALNRLLRFTIRSSTARVPNGIVQLLSKFRQAAGTYTFAAGAATRPVATSSTITPSPIDSRVSAPIQ